MAYAKQMLEVTPNETAFEAEALAAAIQACFDCAQVCTACADACLGERAALELAGHIRRNLDCADVCIAVGRVLSRQVTYDVELVRTMLEACVRSCKLCADECMEHAVVASCGVCAQACRRCEGACRALLPAVSSG